MRDPIKQILVRDDLRITKKELWINDRVFSYPEMMLLIGNTEGIPYKLKKVN